MRSLIIEHPSDMNQRIDKFLKKYLREAPLGGIYKMLRTGKIKVNGKKSLPTYRLISGDEVVFYLSDDEIAHFQQSNLSERVPGEKDLEILYQDDVMLIVNKSAGINVHPGDHKTNEISLIEQVHDRIGSRYDSLTFRPSLVHRIDRDTSGAVMIALDKGALEYLLHELREHQIEKIYHAIVFGKMPKPRDTIDARLIRENNAKNTAKVRVDISGQTAITHYRTLREYQMMHEMLSLLECQIETGRTHQIRVHLSHVGCPIVGDAAYGDHQKNAYFRQNFAIDRQMLHARQLTFRHPKTQQFMTIEAPYPADFLSLLPEDFL